jgi:hypothetical protein
MVLRPSLRCIHKPSPPIIVPLVKHRDHCCPAAFKYALIVRLPPRRLSDTPRIIFSRRAPYPRPTAFGQIVDRKG